MLKVLLVEDNALLRASLADALSGHDVQVVSPKGWAPPGIRRWSGYRDVVPRDTVDDVVVHYPRKVTLPGSCFFWGRIRKLFPDSVPT